MIKNKDGSFTIEAGETVTFNIDDTCRICNKPVLVPGKSFRPQFNDEGEKSVVHTECLDKENN